jgi:hypothetical protein
VPLTHTILTLCRLVTAPFPFTHNQIVLRKLLGCKFRINIQLCLLSE